MYLVGFFIVFLLLLYRIKRGEWQNKNYKFESKIITDLLLYCFFGLLVGARLGHVFFYNFSYFVNNPLEIISPFDPVTHEFIGIYGMSYHGGLIGILIAGLIFARRYRIDFWSLSDFVVPAVPAGYFFGRVGNFINNELYGKITKKPWGMHFKNFSSELRHPSQLYEAFLEGVVLFLFLWIVRNKKIFKNKFFGLYIVSYGIIRFVCEFFRESDETINFLTDYITLGQWLSLIMIFLGMFIVALKIKN